MSYHEILKTKTDHLDLNDHLEFERLFLRRYLNHDIVVEFPQKQSSRKEQKHKKLNRQK